MDLDAFDVPIVTPRLVVRRLEARDLDGLMDANGDEAVTRYLPYATWQSEDDRQAWFVRMTGLQDDGRARQLVVVDRDTDRAIGGILVFAFDDVHGRAELGYVLARKNWGRGVMREALQALLPRVFGALGVRRLEAHVDPRNAASHRLLLALGFRHEGLLRERSVIKGEVVDSNVYGLLEGELIANDR